MKVKKGGASSDWKSTVMSRGPVQGSAIANMPKEFYRQFTNSQYIPNNQLAYYAAPKSTGMIPRYQNPPYPMPAKLL